jgi:anaerobic selenocysteine-containing dehydrogenase
MHPDEAHSRGLADGARIRLGNQTGAITLKLAVSADVPRGVILTHKSRWTANGVASNVNALNPGKKADLAESCAVHSINVSVVPA